MSTSLSYGWQWLNMAIWPTLLSKMECEVVGSNPLAPALAIAPEAGYMGKDLHLPAAEAFHGHVRSTTDRTPAPLSAS